MTSTHLNTDNHAVPTQLQTPNTSNLLDCKCINYYLNHEGGQTQAKNVILLFCSFNLAYFITYQLKRQEEIKKNSSDQNLSIRYLINQYHLQGKMMHFPNDHNHLK